MKTNVPNSKFALKVERLQKKASRGDLGAITALAELYSDGKLVRRNNRKVLDLLLLGAELRDPYLTWCLADAYYNGVGLRRSVEQGLHYYNQAAKLGVQPALTSLALHYFNLADPANRVRAIKLYRKAAKHDDPDAIHNLGVCYSTGQGMSINFKRAYSHFLKAALLGHDEAAFKTGWCLIEGEGVEKNKKKAVFWLNKAARAGHSNAAKLLRAVQKR